MAIPMSPRLSPRESSTSTHIMQPLQPIQTSPPSSQTSSPLPTQILQRSRSASLRHIMTGQVQASLSPITSPASMSGLSASTAASSPHSSLHASPDSLRGREAEFPPAPIDLPEASVSRKSSQGALADSVPSSNKQQQSGGSSSNGGLMRRFSHRASQLTGRRRQSSVAATSRDQSVGPVTMRRRSDSNSTVPEGPRSALFMDGEEDDEDLAQDPFSLDYRDACSTAVSIASSSIRDTNLDPTYPPALLGGTPMTKVTRKKKKRLVFFLDANAAKVTWDRNRPSKCFYIDDIKEIRTGPDARNYREGFGIESQLESRFFSIVVAVPDRSKGRSQKVIHLIADSKELVTLWAGTLDAISKHRHESMVSLSSFNDKAIKLHWRHQMSKQFGDKPHSDEEETVGLKDVESLMANLHIHVSSLELRSKFERADASHSGRLNFAEFQDFVRLMKRRDDVRPVYREVASSTEQGISLEDFLEFVADIQGEDVESNRAYWEFVFYKFARARGAKEVLTFEDLQQPYMDEAALTAFLTSSYNSPIAALPANISLDRPLTDYFISSSHNTYLLGRQVAGESSVEAYIAALAKGCRCVEVDCWNGSDGWPVVMHGRTLTTQVSFADVMTTINKYAFLKTPFPLWISLEVHCNDLQQARMAEIIKVTCGERLVTEPLDPTATTLPTPSQLLNRILIKVKKPKVIDEAVVLESPSSVGRSRGSSLSSPYLRPTQVEGIAIPSSSLPNSDMMSPRSRPTRFMSRSQPKVPSISEQDSYSSISSDSESYTDETTAKFGDGSRRKGKKTSNIIKVLGELGVYGAGLKFCGFDDPESKAHNHIFSFMEQTFAKNSKSTEDKRALVRHNMRYMMRVYPNGWRIGSTNFDPLTYWRRGVQMVALNWQTYDLGMQLNDAMFASGADQTGYVLKPSELREIRMLPNEMTGHVKRERKYVSFSIDVISAQQLMRPKNVPAHRGVDSYVEVEVYHADDKAKNNRGVIGEGGLDASGRDSNSGLGAPHRRRTRIVIDNGFNPTYDNKFNFELTTKYPDLVFVRFTVRTSPDGLNYSDRQSPLAVYTAKLSALKQGYRTLPLMDTNGEQFLFSTLFCHVKVETPTSIYVNGPEAPENVGVLKGLGRAVFSRNPISPKSSLDSGS